MKQALSGSNWRNAAREKCQHRTWQGCRHSFCYFPQRFKELRIFRARNEGWNSLSLWFLSKDKHWSGTSPTTLKVAIKHNSTALRARVSSEVSSSFFLPTAAAALLAQVLIKTLLQWPTETMALITQKRKSESLPCKVREERRLQQRGRGSELIASALPLLPLHTWKQVEKLDWHHFFFYILLMTFLPSFKP